MSRRRRRYKYAEPNAGRVRYRLRCAVLRVAALVFDAGESISVAANNVADRLSRPRCVYPGCRGDIANWIAESDYCPVDSGLCEEHHQVQGETIQRFYKSADFKQSGLSNPMLIVDAEDVSKAWAKWHAREMK